MTQPAQKHFHEAFYVIGQHVQIVLLKWPAIIEAIMFEGKQDAQYRVLYWWDGERRTTWVTGDEIRELEPSE